MAPQGPKKKKREKKLIPRDVGRCWHPTSWSPKKTCPDAPKHWGWKTSFLLGRPIFRGYVSFKEGNYKPLSFPKCSMYGFFLPTLGGVKNGHMNKGKWLGKYYHPMEHLGMIFVMFLSAKKTTLKPTYVAPCKLVVGRRSFPFGKAPISGANCEFWLLFAERLWELRKKLLNDYENESSVL